MSVPTIRALVAGDIANLPPLDIAAIDFLAGYTGRTRQTYGEDLKAYLDWCTTAALRGTVDLWAADPLARVFRDALVAVEPAVEHGDGGVLFDAGADLRAVQQQLRHVDPKTTTQSYDVRRRNHAGQASHTLAAFLGNLGE